MFLRHQHAVRRALASPFLRPNFNLSQRFFATEEVSKYPEELTKIIFTSTCKSTGGRVGTVESVGDSGSGLKLNLEKHVNHGGGEGKATNPEGPYIYSGQLFTTRGNDRLYKTTLNRQIFLEKTLDSCGGGL